MRSTHDVEKAVAHRRVTQVIGLALAILVPGGVIVLGLLAILRSAGRRTLGTPHETRRAA